MSSHLLIEGTSSTYPQNNKLSSSLNKAELKIYHFSGIVLSLVPNNELKPGKNGWENRVLGWWELLLQTHDVTRIATCGKKICGFCQCYYSLYTVQVNCQEGGWARAEKKWQIKWSGTLTRQNLSCWDSIQHCDINELLATPSLLVGQ